jgi:tyrosinase
MKKSVTENAGSYWDWSLDWEHPSRSSIWDSSTGFGGDGQIDGEEIVGHGRCVVDGPLIELRPLYYNYTYTPHCLTRGFRDGKTFGTMNGSSFSPENIGRLMRQPTFDTFLHLLEMEIHNTIHKGIGGDFMSLTAPNGE